MITQTYTLSLQPGGVPLRVPCVQGENLGRTLEFTLTSCAAAANLPDGLTVTIEGTKPDGKSFSAVAGQNGDTVTVTLTQQMCAVAGEVPCQLTLADSSAVIATARFLLEVAPSAIPGDGDLSQSELTALTAIRTDILTALGQMQAIKAALTSGSWTPAVSGAESYDHQVGTYAVVGNLAIVSFAVKGKFASEADGELSITGCPVSPGVSAAGGGQLSGYYAADNILFTGWMIAPGGTITGQCGWATTKGHKYASVAYQGKGSSFRACGTIAFPIS